MLTPVFVLYIRYNGVDYRYYGHAWSSSVMIQILREMCYTSLHSSLLFLLLLHIPEVGPCVQFHHYLQPKQQIVLLMTYHFIPYH